MSCYKLFIFGNNSELFHIQNRFRPKDKVKEGEIIKTVKYGIQVDCQLKGPAYWESVRVSRRNNFCQFDVTDILKTVRRTNPVMSQLYEKMESDTQKQHIAPGQPKLVGKGLFFVLC